ncbi:MAG: PD-(D/E)XK nuclease family protein [Magnetococcales bacterium]|nr:PD-(D/E)XK nuclease family protein [Magnetococcales bacterium]
MQKKEWQQALSEEWTVITINQRLPRYLEGQYEIKQRKAGLSIWPTPDILPFQSWLDRCWRSLLDVQPPEFILLSEVQERLIWERVVARSGDKGNLLWTQSAAQSAHQAWNLLASWSLDLPHAESFDDEDARAFCRWAESFQRQCEKRRWLPRGGLIAFICQYLDRISLPKGVVLAGFDEISPSQSTLFTQLESLGVPVCLWQQTARKNQVKRVMFADWESEILAAARWARGEIEAGEIKGDAASRPVIGIVVPELQTLRSPLIRLFSEVFYPGLAQSGSFPDQPLFNLSLGAPLSDYPIVRDGLQLLAWTQNQQDWQTGSGVLASPYWRGGDSEWAGRGALDAYLRKQGHLFYSCSDIIQNGEKRIPKSVSALQDALQLLAEKREERAVEQLPEYWAHLFDLILKRLGWPGEKTVSSQEFQAIEAFRKLLASFSGLELVLGSLPEDQALEILCDLAASTTFQPKNSEAQVHILGALEAEGERFDGVWMLGLTDQKWPMIPEPNPFLPFEFQRTHQLPRSTAQRELLFAKGLTHRILGAAPISIASYFSRDGDMEQRVSPLIASIPRVEPESLIRMEYPLLAAVSMQEGGLSSMRENLPRPFAADIRVTGGTSLLKSQALCPFSAFAKFRLNAQPLEDPAWGFNAAERGEITHQGLANFWGQVKTLQTLKSLSVEEKKGLIRNSVKKAVLAQEARSAQFFPKAYLQLEMTRQKRLLEAWLALEQGREIDFIVAEREMSGQLSLGGMQINFRIDRIDQLLHSSSTQGDRVIVDYKTGSVNINHWFSDRPQEPQMLIYGLYLGDRLAALAYGQLSAQKNGFCGLTDRDSILPGLEVLADGKRDPDRLDWPAILKEWRRIITALAEQYCQGESGVDPLNNACQWCELPLLCRVAEIQSSQTSDCLGEPHE